jgi:hypothetical protein
MKNHEQPGGSLMRSAIIVGVGAVGIGLLLIPITRRADPALPTTATAEEVANDTPTVARATHAPPGAPRHEPLQFGAVKEKPEITRAADCPLKDFKLIFKQDPRLTRSLYMGDRWISPSRFTITGAGPECTLHAQAQGIDVQGKPVPVNADWTATDPSMVTLSPGPGKAVEITVHRVGQTTLEVASLGISKKLPLNALAYGDTIVVEVYQR